MESSPSIEQVSAQFEKFIGPRSKYYLRVFYTQILEKRRVGWNWAAFFLGPIWFAYRKLYLPAVALAAVMFGFGLAGSFVSTPVAGMLLRIAFLALLIIVGMYGNYFYRVHALQQLAYAEGESAGDLEARGGVNLAAGVALAVAMSVPSLPDVIRMYQERFY
jgi:hypothetical protein